MLRRTSQLGEIQHRHFWDFEAAAASYAKARELNPGSASVRSAYSRFLSKSAVSPNPLRSGDRVRAGSEIRARRVLPRDSLHPRRQISRAADAAIEDAARRLSRTTLTCPGWKRTGTSEWELPQSARVGRPGRACVPAIVVVGHRAASAGPTEQARAALERAHRHRRRGRRVSNRRGLRAME